MLTNSAAQTEAKRPCAGRKTLTGATLWAREFPVWARENPVALTVERVPHALRRDGEGDWRVFPKEFSEDLTKDCVETTGSVSYCQKPTASCLRYFRSRGQVVDFAGIFAVNDGQRRDCTLRLNLLQRLLHRQRRGRCGGGRRRSRRGGGWGASGRSSRRCAAGQN